MFHLPDWGILSRESVIVLNGPGQARESGRKIYARSQVFFSHSLLFVLDRHNLLLYKISKYTELYSPEVAIWLLMFCWKNMAPLHFGPKRQNRRRIRVLNAINLVTLWLAWKPGTSPMRSPLHKTRAEKTLVIFHQGI